MRGSGPLGRSGSDRYRWVVLAAGALGAGAVSGLRQGMPALGPALRDHYGLSLAQAGLVFAAVPVGIMLALVPWGTLTDRIGERPVMTAGLVGTGLALVATAFAPGFGGVLLGLGVAGAFGASATGASGRAVMGWFHRSERGFALGLRQMALPLGGGIAALVLPHLVGGGMRIVFLALAGTMFVSAAVAVVLMRDPPTSEPPAGFSAPPPTRDARLWRLGAGSALLVVAQGTLVGFLVLFLHDERGLSPAAAAAGLATLQLAGALARIVIGRRSDRLERRIIPMRRVAVADTVLLAATAALAHAPGAILYPVLLAAGIVAMSWNGLAFTAAAEISGRARAGTAMSLQNTIIAAAGAAAPVAFGALVSATSWPVGYAVMALTPAAAWFVLAPLEGEEDERAARRAHGREAPGSGCRAARPATLSPVITHAHGART